MNDDKKDLAAALLLVAAVAVVYHKVYGFEYLSYDDDIYLLKNEHVQGGVTLDSLIWAFTSSYHAMWQPLIWISHMLEIWKFGMKPGPPHVINAMLHAANAVMMYLALSEATGSRLRSAFAAALFAVHPQHVESVAWITERKDVLSAFFWWSSILAYVRYTKNPSAQGYAAVAALFAAGLCSKAMLVTLPFVLLLLDWWPLGRLSGDRTIHPARPAWSPSIRPALEKIPLFALTAAVSVITVISQGVGQAIKTTDQFPVTMRFFNAATSYVMYLAGALWPSGLSVLYPYHPVPWWRAAAAAVVLTGVSFMALANAGKRRYLAVGWLWYLGTLVPVIGLVQVGMQSRADRYTYIPMAGVYIMAAWGIPEVFHGVRRRREILAAASAAVLSVLMVCAINQTGCWRNSRTLFERTIAVTRDNAVAQVNLGLALALSDKAREALPHFKEAVRIDPALKPALYNYGVTLSLLGRSAEAARQLAETLRLDPSDAHARLSYGITLADAGRTDEAVREFKEALRLDPANADVLINIGIIHAHAGRLEDAAREFQRAVMRNPSNETALYNLGLMRAMEGRPEAAVRWFKRAVRVKPDYLSAYFNLGTALMALGETAGAAQAFAEAVRLNPSDPAARTSLGLALAAVGDLNGAQAQFEETLRLQPDSDEARGYLKDVRETIKKRGGE
jgi:tetratricopeptide (TPR) repeat protein